MSTSDLRAAFIGCSATLGEGFPETLRDQYIYDRLVSKHFNFKRTNLGVPGNSNYRIFMQAINTLKSKQFDIVFVQWTEVHRIWFSPGPGSWLYVNMVNSELPSYQYRDLYVSSRELKNFLNLTLVLNHDYQNLIDLIDYCSCLELLAEQTNNKIVFINGCVVWKDDLVTPIKENLAESLSDYTKEVLDFDHRSDDEIFKYFSTLQNKAAELNQSKWVNLFESWSLNYVDVGPEGHHFGINSHQWLSNKIINYIEENKIL